MKYTESRGIFLISIFSFISIILILLGVAFIINPMPKEPMQTPINQGLKQLKSK